MALVPPTPTITSIATISTHTGSSLAPTVWPYTLTTQFTPPAECLASTYVWGTSDSARVEVGPDYVPSCWPAPWPSLSGSLSPAFCPAGYTIASVSAYLGRFVADADNPSATIASYTETHLTCCPSLTHAFSGVDEFDNCRYSFSDAIATEVATLQRFESLTALVTSDTTVIEQTNWTTTVETVIGVTPLPSAHGIKVAFQHTDQEVLAQWSASVAYAEPVNSAASSSSPPPPAATSSTFVLPTRSGGGSSLSGGGVAFVAIGVVLGLALIFGLVYFYMRYRRKKAREAAAEEEGQFGGKHELDSTAVGRESQVPLSAHTPVSGWQSPAYRDSIGGSYGRHDTIEPADDRYEASELPTSHVAAHEMPSEHKLPPSELPTPVLKR